MRVVKATVGLLAAVTCLTLVGGAQATIIAGFNLDVPPSGPFWAPYDPLTSGTSVFIDELEFDPNAGPIEKHFQTPVGLTGQIIPLQPGGVILIDEDWPIIGTRPVSDWHEIILTPGWAWDFTPFGATGGPPLITQNGDPWPYETSPDTPPGSSEIWVDFPPIFPGNVLDIHKRLVWLGTEGNTIWGDDPANEFFVQVIEYPTPEPASVALLALGGLMLLRRR